jgi:hypothetical protein
MGQGFKIITVSSEVSLSTCQHQYILSPQDILLGFLIKKKAMLPWKTIMYYYCFSKEQT